MFCARLIDLRRTTSFRLSLGFLCIFGAMSVALFAWLYYAIGGFETQRVDGWLGREYQAMQRSTPARLATQFAVLAQGDPEQQRPNGMFKMDGSYIAGSLHLPPPHLPPFGQPFEMRLTTQPGTPVARCIALRLADAQFAMRCQNAEELNTFNQGLLKVLLTGACMTLGVGLAGAVLIGLAALRRLDAVTDAIRQIVAGDLSQRLPTHRKRDDLDRLVRVVNGMLDEIERLMHEVKGVCDAIAHDLRTPLTRLIAGLERVQRRSRNIDDYRLALDETFIEANGMLRTFNALLRISDIESGMRRQSFAPVDLAAVARDVFEYYEPSAQEKVLSYTYQCEIAPGVGLPLDGDANLLFEALANLVANAIKFTPMGGMVVLRLQAVNDGWQFSVQDTGPGIPASEHKAVLQRFYRGEASRHTPGNGLGLSLAQAIATMHGMTLNFGSSGVGCTVTLTSGVVPPA